MQAKIESIVKEACQNYGVSLYDLELKPTGHGKVLVIYLTKLGGIKVEDCQRVSRIIERDLEAEDLIKGRYYLEVSSPGLERELKKKSHFISAINEHIKLIVQEESGNRRLRGRLIEVNPQSITLNTEEDTLEEIDLHRIRKAKTLFDHKQDLKKSSKSVK